MAGNVAHLVGQADRAAASGDFAAAVSLLTQAADASPEKAEFRLRLAAMQRATGDLQAALQSIHRGLALAPLDFTLLLMRASLLQRLGDAEAGEAWGHALAQRPAIIPPQLAAAIEEAQTRHAEHIDRQSERFDDALRPSVQAAGPEEQARIERFRDNALRRTRPFHSNPTHFHFPELTEREFHPRRLFPWIEEIEAATDVIAAEMRAVMAAERAELVPYVQYDEHLPLDQWRELNHNLDWTAIHLLRGGETIDANARHCPETMALMKRLPQPNIAGVSPNAMFSLLAPGAAIPPHVGYNNARLVCHLPLVVPDGCWFRVGAQTRQWRRGEALLFDDTIEHEAANPSEELRVVLIFDVWHPDLSAAERESVAALIAVAGSPHSA